MVNKYPDQLIIINHTTTDLSKVPPYWINKAKELLRLSYGHTSHGSQLVSGMDTLESLNALYSFNTDGAIADRHPVAGRLHARAAISAIPIAPPGPRCTRSYLNSGTAPGNNRNTVMWSWCGQVSSASEADINTYLNLMNQLETDYPAVNFIYMTGHLDGSGAERQPVHAQQSNSRVCPDQRQGPVRFCRHRELRSGGQLLSQWQRRVRMVC